MIEPLLNMAFERVCRSNIYKDIIKEVIGEGVEQHLKVA